MHTSQRFVCTTRQAFDAISDLWGGLRYILETLIMVSEVDSFGRQELLRNLKALQAVAAK